MREDVPNRAADTVSVVVPVYNSARHLPQCVDSVLRQSHGNLDVLLVDDGSIDDSLASCERYARADARVRVVSLRHGGPSAARNEGLALARGEHVVFVDSDDYLDPDMVRQLRAAIGDDGVDCAICGFTVHDLRRSSDPRENVLKIVESPGGLISARELAATYWECYDRGWVNPLWNKIYRTSIIRDNGLRFPDGIPIGEDGYFNGRYFLNARTIRVLGNPLYHHQRHVGQSNLKRFPDYFGAMSRNFDVIEAFVRKHDGFADPACRERHEREFFRVLKDSLHHIAGDRGLTRREKLRAITRCLRDERSRSVLARVRVRGAKDALLLSLMKSGFSPGLALAFSLQGALQSRCGGSWRS